jgi:uncharacterized Tic20 family protein
VATETWGEDAYSEMMAVRYAITASKDEEYNAEGQVHDCHMCAYICMCFVRAVHAGRFQPFLVWLHRGPSLAMPSKTKTLLRFFESAMIYMVLSMGVWSWKARVR